MAEAPSNVLQSALVELAPEPGVRIGRRLRLVSSEEQRAVFLDGTAIAIYDCQDRLAETATVAMLAKAGVASQVALAEAFGRHPNTVWRSVRRLEQGGMASVLPAKRGPKGPHKVTPEVLALVEARAELGRVTLQRLVAERTGIRLSSQHLSELQKRSREGRRGQPELGFTEEVVKAPEVEVRAAAQTAVEVAPETAVQAVEPPMVVPTQAGGRYLGAALYYPALQVLGLLEAALACFRLPNSELFGVRATTLTLFYLSLFGKTTVEAAKHLRRWEFGPLVGSRRAPAVKTLRRKLAELVQQAQASRFGEILSRRWVEQSVVATAYLYVDGHMKLYTGKRKLAEIWNSQRRMPLPGVLTYFVNDPQGRPLLFVTEEANASLGRALPRVVSAIREVLKERAFTVIFDRGGYDGKLFDWLRGEKIDFITYQRGEPGLRAKRFRRRECRFEGRRVRMQLAEDSVRVSRSGPWRRIVLRTKEGHQTPILTSLGPELGAARIASLMFARWRQENFFRYMREHHGLDQLLGYAFSEADGGRLVANPARKAIDGELKTRRQELVALRAELGQALLEAPRDGNRSVHGLKIAQKGSVGKVRPLEARIAELIEARHALPKQVPLAAAGQREVMQLEQKAIIDRIKITAYNAEEWLLDRLIRHYPNPHDVRALLRSFAELSGDIATNAKGVIVTLDPPDTPQHRQALRGLCRDLNALGATYPGTALTVTYQVSAHHSELAV